MVNANEKLKNHVAKCDQCSKALNLGDMCQTGVILSRVIENRTWLEENKE